MTTALQRLQAVFGSAWHVNSTACLQQILDEIEGGDTAGVDPVSTAINTVGAGVLTAAALVGGLVSRGGTQTAAFSDATDTAAAIIAAMPNQNVGTSQWVYVANTTSYPQTITGGASVSASGTLVIPPGSVLQALMTITSATAVSFVGIGVLSAAQQTLLTKAVFLAPLPADTTGSTPVLVAPVTPSNVALTIAYQPPQARKLIIQIHIGTPTTTAITAGNLALVGADQDGNAVSENISLIENATAIKTSKWAYSSITSATVSAYAANGSGTGNTIGIGQSNDFGVPTCVGVSNFALVKSSKIITTFTPSSTAASIAWARAVTDDAAGSATVDAVARTVAPTTAPGTAGINDYEFTCSYNPPS
jgi:hypothetical protein